jgi:hypothetical protein
LDRARAARLVEKLEAVTVARGATAGEARSAAAKADGLRRRFDLHAAPKSKPPRRRSEPRGGTPFTRVWVVPEDDAPWDFNVQTGEASSNVRVKHYSNPGNWSIEIPFP